MSEVSKDKGRKAFALKIVGSLSLMCVIGVVVIWLSTYWLDLWTHHGESIEVPDVKGMHFDKAKELLESEDFEVVLQDSVYVEKVAPGSVVDQNPKVGSNVKPGRTIYLTINAFYPRTVAVPPLTDISVRQAVIVLEGLDLKNYKIKEVPSEYPGLVLAASYKGKRLTPGMRVPMTAQILLEVGVSLDFESMRTDTVVGYVAPTGEDNEISTSSSESPATQHAEQPAAPNAVVPSAQQPAADPDDDGGFFD